MELNLEIFVKKAVFATNISYNLAIGTSPYIIINLENLTFEFEDCTKVNSRKYDANVLENRKNIIEEKYSINITKIKKTLNDELKIGDLYLCIK
jgi:hypothetical protein